MCDEPIEARILPSCRFVAPAAWVDGNGHVNAAFYQLMVKDPAIEAHDAWGYGQRYHAETGRSSFVLESHVTHLGEVKGCDTVVVTSRITDLDTKRLHILFEIRNETSGTLAALVQYLTIFVVMHPKPRTAPFPPELRARLLALREAHAQVALPERARDLPRLGLRARPGESDTARLGNGAASA